MITLNFGVEGQLLTRQDENTVAANSRLVHLCEFTFSNEWEGRGKVATFKKRDLMLSVIVDDNDTCVIPPEILQSDNKIDVFELSVCGADGNSTITSTIVRVPILAGTWDPFTEEITPTLFEQIMAKIDEIEKGEVSPELVYEAVSEYMEAHPLEPIIADDVAAYFAEHAEELKGPKGDTGATPSITATAEVNNAVGTPSVTVTKTGTTEAPNLNFAFQNLKGAKGDTGATPTISAAATVDNTTGTPGVEVSKSGTSAAPNFTFAFTGLKGAKGDKGDDGASYDDTEIRGMIDDVWKVQGEFGAKNLISTPYIDKDVTTRNGINYTLHSDGSITFSGTATGYSYYILNKEMLKKLGAGVYTLNAHQSSPLPNGCGIVLLDKITNAQAMKIWSNNIKDTVEITQELTSHYSDIRITINSGSIIATPITVYPMIRYASDTDDTWQPYAKSNKQLTEEIKGLADKITPFNILDSKKWCVCGDSFTAGDFTNYVDSEGHSGRESDAYDTASGHYKTYPWWIGNRNNMDVQWLAAGGADFTNIEGSTNPFSANSSYINYTQIANDCDYITLMYGLNETGLTTAQIGTSSDSTNATLWGAYNVVLTSILTANPTVKIGIIIADAWMNQTYHDALIEIANYWGIPYLDLKNGEQVPLMIGGRFRNTSPTAVSLKNAAFKCSESDAHPNVEAHKYRSTVIEQFLRSL